MADPGCHNCRFWAGRRDGDAHSCLRYPPQMAAGEAFWPQTRPTDWCGEHREKHTEEASDK